VKAKLPLPTMKGDVLSTRVRVGLWRVTNAWRSMGLCAWAFAARPAANAIKQTRTTRESIAAEYEANAVMRARR
jgi:hypothetical protein